MSISREGVWKMVLERGKLILSAFLAGTGIVFWAMGVFLNPVTQLKNEMTEVRGQIQTINENHLTHIQAYMEENTDTVKDIYGLLYEINGRLSNIEGQLDK